MSGLSKDALTKGMQTILTILIMMVSVGAIGVLGPLVIGAIQYFAISDNVSVSSYALTLINSTGNTVIGLFATVIAPITLIVGLIGLVVLLGVFGLDKIFKNMFGSGKKKGKSGGFQME